MVKIQALKMFDDVRSLEKATDVASGWDCFAYSYKMLYKHGGGNGETAVPEEIITSRFIEDDQLRLQHLERVMIGTGLKLAIEPGYEFQVRPRSGLALKKGLTVVNTPGTIDSDYRGELCVVIINLSRADQFIKLGDKIAQIVPAPILLDIIEYVDNLPETLRSDKGFGSSGT
jgi:dUTP pyrophosphatase